MIADDRSGTERTESLWRYRSRALGAEKRVSLNMSTIVMKSESSNTGRRRPTVLLCCTAVSARMRPAGSESSRDLHPRLLIRGRAERRILPRIGVLHSMLCTNPMQC